MSDSSHISSSDVSKYSFASPLHRKHFLQSLRTQGLLTTLQKLGQGSIIVFGSASFVVVSFGSAAVSDVVGMQSLSKIMLGKCTITDPS